MTRPLSVQRTPLVHACVHAQRAGVRWPSRVQRTASGSAGCTPQCCLWPACPGSRAFAGVSLRGSRAPSLLALRSPKGSPAAQPPRPSPGPPVFKALGLTYSQPLPADQRLAALHMVSAPPSAICVPEGGCVRRRSTGNPVGALSKELVGSDWNIQCPTQRSTWRTEGRADSEVGGSGRLCASETQVPRALLSLGLSWAPGAAGPPGMFAGQITGERIHRQHDGPGARAGAVALNGPVPPFRRAL